MKMKNFLPKKTDGGFRVRPWRTIVSCVLIAVLLVSISLSMSYSKYTFVSDPLSTTYQVKDYVLPADRYVIQPTAFAATGTYRFVSPDTTVAVAYSKQSTDPDYLGAEYLSAFFNPGINTIDYTLNSNQIILRYEIGLTGINHDHPLEMFGLKSSINNQPRGIVVYVKVGTDADPESINSSSLTLQYVYPESPAVTKSGIASVGQIAISNLSQLYRYSTEDELLNSRFELKYDKKAWSEYADTTWYNDSDTEFRLSTAAQLSGLAELVNSGTAFEGKTIYLTQNISLADANGYLRRWTPIGTYEHPFKGSFDGQGKTISGLNVADFGASGDTAAAGLFGYVSGDATATIKDLTIDTAYVSAELYEDLTVTPSSARNSSGAEGTLVGWAEGYTFSGISIQNAKLCGIAKCGGGMIGRCDSNTSVSSCVVDDDTTVSVTGYSEYAQLIGYGYVASPNP